MENLPAIREIKEKEIISSFLLVSSSLCLPLSPGVFVVSAKRTPFGTYGGVLKDHTATDLATHAAKAALAAGGVAPELVNSVIVGNVMQVHAQQPHAQHTTCTANHMNSKPHAQQTMARGKQ